MPRKDKEMTNEIIFYTQIVSIIGFIIALFSLYGLLVKQKDSVIELLKQRIELLEKEKHDLQSQSPDVLVESLAKRVEISLTEIHRLKEDGEDHKGQILEKETELNDLRNTLKKLNILLEENDLLCPHCQAPLAIRDWKTIYGHSGGREVEVDVEYVEYECGYATLEGEAEPLGKCKNEKNFNQSFQRKPIQPGSC